MILDMPSCVERCSATSLKGLMSSYEGERFSHLTSRGDFAALERFPRSRRSHPQRSGSLDSHRTEAGARGVGLLGAESRGRRATEKPTGATRSGGERGCFSSLPWRPYHQRRAEPHRGFPGRGKGDEWKRVS